MGPPVAPWRGRVSRLFVREPISESVTTRMHFDARLDLVWRHLLFYEDVPARTPFPLRIVLPHPLRTDGDKTRVGSQVRCAYSRGEVVKRITVVERACLLQFDVVEQNLGIEDCVLTQSGSYRFFRCGDGTDVALATTYLAFLHPRRLWRPLETLLARQLHRHIFAAVRATLDLLGPLAPADLAPSCRRRLGSAGGLACTTSPSRFHR
jgi:hypothetical protein